MRVGLSFTWTMECIGVDMEEFRYSDHHWPLVQRATLDQGEGGYVLCMYGIGVLIETVPICHAF